MSRTAAFAMSGALWVGSLLVSAPQMIYYPMPNIISLAVVYVLIGTAAIAWFSEKFVAALLGLWVLAMVFCGVLLLEPRSTAWTLFLGGSFFGTIAFLMWCVVAFLLLVASKGLRSHFGRG